FLELPNDLDIIVDFSSCKLVDHSFLTFITQFKNNFDESDFSGHMTIIGLDNHKSLSKHPLSTKKLIIK
ncbi:MAG: hypothetical protein KDD29_06695, partial [Flavobacteriales bacterium]|nr:hypothetical protein [Flavobacteriales bacterium]